MIKEKNEPTLKSVARSVDTLAQKVDDLTQTVGSLAGTVDDLARMTAKGFESMATKQELQAVENKVQKLEDNMTDGFSLVMEALRPMQRNYDALNDDLGLRMSTVEARLTKVERKISV